MKSIISRKTQKGLPSPINGRGFFAVEDIPKGQFVASKGGRLMSIGEALALPFNSHGEHYHQQIDRDRCLCPATIEATESSMIYINHSCDPNVGLLGEITYVAMRDIKKGEELTVDYAMMDNQDYEMKCGCGSPQCRGIVTGQDFKLPGMERRYRSYLSPHIKRELDIIAQSAPRTLFSIKGFLQANTLTRRERPMRSKQGTSVIQNAKRVWSGITHLRF